MKIVLFAALATLMLASGASWAADDLAARRVVAKEYLYLSAQATDFGAVAAQVAPAILGSIQQRQPALFSSKRARLTEIVEQFLEASIRNATLDLDADMAKAFSIEELTALRDFYASQVGMSVMTKMPAFMGAAMPRVMQASTADLGTMMQQLRAEGVRVD